MIIFLCLEMYYKTNISNNLLKIPKIFFISFLPFHKGIKIIIIKMNIIIIKLLTIKNKMNYYIIILINISMINITLLI